MHGLAAIQGFLERVAQVMVLVVGKSLYPPRFRVWK